MYKSMKRPSFDVKLMMQLPAELLLEILTRLHGKQVARCKCVCRTWRSIIGSPQFLVAYRSRQLNLILYWLERSDQLATDGKHFRLRFFGHSLWRSREPTAEFSYLSEMRTGRFRDRLTEVVNGLVCVCESDLHLTLYNVCTGQGMRLPDPTRYDLAPTSSFHLGYDPISRIYKLMRLIHPFTQTGDCRFEQIKQPLQVEILNLRPSGSKSTWRKLENTAASGIGDLLEWRGFFGWFETSLSGDGIVWLSGKMSLLSFDINKEKFQLIKIPEEAIDALKLRWFNLNDSRMHGYIFTLSMGRPALWIRTDHPKCLMLFVLEADDGNRWSMRRVQFPEELGEVDSCSVQAGNLPTGELLLMNAQVNDQDGCRPIYSYNHLTDKFDRNVVGKHPEKPDYHVLWSNEKLIHSRLGTAKVSCLRDNNHLHLPLDDVLSGRFTEI